MKIFSWKSEIPRNHGGDRVDACVGLPDRPSTGHHELTAEWVSGGKPCERCFVNSIKGSQQSIGATSGPPPLPRNVFRTEVQASEMVGGETLLTQ